MNFLHALWKQFIKVFFLGEEDNLCFTVHYTEDVKMDEMHSIWKKPTYLVVLEIWEFLQQIQPQFCLPACHFLDIIEAWH